MENFKNRTGRSLRILLLILLLCSSGYSTPDWKKERSSITQKNRGKDNHPAENDEVKGYSAVPESDSLALVRLVRTTHGPGWVRHDNWNEGPVDTWFGVTVTDGRVTRLELPENNLTGIITPDIGFLDKLQVLNLGKNNLTGAVPDIIADLSELRELYLYDNQLEDLPRLVPVGDGHTLSILSVENNSFTFEDLEPNVGLAATFSYAPQDMVGEEETLIVFEGKARDISIPVGGEHNRYQWYQNGHALEGATDGIYSIFYMTPADEGTYELEITNTLLSDLTLISYPIHVELDKYFSGKWLDVGSYHHIYAETGAIIQQPPWEWEKRPRGMQYPAILRHSGHISFNAFWIGVKDWTDQKGEHFPYYVANIGYNRKKALANVTFPILNNLIGRYRDTIVEVNGVPSIDKEAGLSAIDPGLPADRIVHNMFNVAVGITVDRKIYAYTNQYHDNYHVIENTFCNTGNTDGDWDIELPEQTLHGVYFFWLHRWRGNEQAAYTGADLRQLWGGLSMHDTVGDGHEEYPVDFSAQYSWYGYDYNNYRYISLGSPLIQTDLPLVSFNWLVSSGIIAEGDTVGRLSGPTMVGRSTIHADRSTTDRSYDRNQPSTMGWIHNDGPILDPYNQPDPTHEEYYELGIRTVENPDRNPHCSTCFSRMYPHYADRVESSGEFWNPSNHPAFGSQGGYSATTAYGPYEMGSGECVNVVVSEGIAGLSFDAATKIGRAYKRSGTERDGRIIQYDADGNGVIDYTPFDYDQVFVGTEAQTKNQWVMSARDSLFQMFYRARDLYEASNGMTRYPIAEPPRPPVRFSVWGLPDRIDMEWTLAPDGPAVEHWEIYRTEKWVDNLYVNVCLEDLLVPCGYELVVSLPESVTSYPDTDVVPGTDYYYFIQGIGLPQPVDPTAINGTPYGQPLRSGRYLTQTYDPVSLLSSTIAAEENLPEKFALEGNYPNPFNPQTTIRYTLPETADVELVVYDVLGREVAILVREHQVADRYEPVFSAADLPSGLYMYVLQAGGNRASGLMLLVK